jgi:hypothetical protein
MKIKEAKKQLQQFINAYENKDIREMVKQKYGDLGHVRIDYEATKVLLEEMERLREALKQCSPLHLEDVIGYCIFCGNQLDESEDGHSDDCEYLRLT